MRPPGGLPPQGGLLTGRAALTEAYCVIPRGCQTDIVCSYLPGWRGMRMWVLARPMSGLAETFSHYLLELSPGGGSDAPETAGAQAVLYVEDGAITLTLEGTAHEMGVGGYAYVPGGADWSLHAAGGARVHWYRKAWVPAPGASPPAGFVTAADAATVAAMPGTGAWATRRFVDPADTDHDFHVNIVELQPGGTIPFEETHVMEHSIYVLEGKAAYLLNRDWVEMEAGDVAILRAFCPQACHAAGPGPFRYLLYKDVNRHAPLAPPGGAPPDPRSVFAEKKERS